MDASEQGLTARLLGRPRLIWRGRPLDASAHKPLAVAYVLAIRREAVAHKVTYYTTLAGAFATCQAIDHLQDVEVNRLQDLHKEVHV